MKQKIYSTVVIVFFAVCLYLYAAIYQSSLYFEDNRAIVNNLGGVADLTVGLQKPKIKDSFIYDTYLQDPANLEIYIRAGLLSPNKNPEELSQLYHKLLKTRPTWPYYYSGLVQVNNLAKHLKSSAITRSIYYGKHERLVVYSLAEMLFYGWEKIAEIDRKTILEHLIDQEETVISRTISISAKFAKIYQYCDYIFEKKHVEYAACKRNYWQPLSD